MILSSQLLRRAVFAYSWSIGLWMAFTPLNAAQDKIRLLERGVDTPFWSLLISNTAWFLTAALLTPPIFLIVSKFPITSSAAISRRVAAYVFGSVPYLFASLCVRWLVLPPWDSVHQTWGHRSFQTLFSNVDLFAFQVWDYIAIVIAAHAYEYFMRVRKRDVEHAEMQQALAAAELQSLKTQLQPHFLFNTLHGIATLIEGDKVRAKAMILKLSTLLRTSLQYSNSDVITLNEEIRFIEAYLDIEKMRLDGRLNVRWGIQEDTRQCLVPQLILQPLVENAIVHGVACSREGGWVEITSRIGDGQLEMTVRNTVRGTGRSGLGFGLHSVKARLKYLYLDEATLTFTMDAGVASATLLLPALGASQSAAALSERSGTPVKGLA